MRVLPLCFLIVLLAGCAQTGTLREGAAGLIQARGMTPHSARDTITVGRSTKADVAAALGRATVVSFDSGYEVWVYRWAGKEPTTRAATELVVLFEPSGLVRKTRIRPGYAAQG